MEANLDYSDFLVSRISFLLYPVFYEYQLVAFRIQNNFLPPEKLNSPNEKELQDVISRLKVFFSDETDRIPSHILTSTFMSHSVLVSVVLYMFLCVPVLHPCQLNLITEANMLRNIYFFRCSNYFLIFCTLATLLMVFTFAYRQFYYRHLVMLIN